MGNQSASRRQGDRFQDLYCLREILRLLQDRYPYEYASRLLLAAAEG